MLMRTVNQVQSVPTSPLILVSNNPARHLTETGLLGESENNYQVHDVSAVARATSGWIVALRQVKAGRRSRTGCNWLSV
jgi:uncharacterized protein (DUF1800 family)